MNLGLVFKSGDAVLIGVFLCLIAMSITTWVLILLRGVRYRAARRSMLSASLPRNAYLEREMRHSIGKILSRFEGGMMALATIGSTAPFVGLLGTVWGIYHALINISNSGQMSIAAVAGPIGEALVATAVGLFAAIPAVLAYNVFMRGNKNLSRELHGFAHDFHVQLINEKE